jgi:solute carrier family 25 (mitochondrial folate transporter), member 32
MSSPNPPLASPISRLQIYSTQIPAAYITPFCGAGAGIASGIITCPLDVIKTKLQAQGGFAARKNGRISPSSAAYSGMVGTARVIWHNEGLRGLYRGLNPMLLGYLPTWAVYLTVYEKSKDFYETKFSEWICMTTRARGGVADLFRRQLVGWQVLLLTDGWCLFDNPDESNLGDKNEIDVSKQ